MSSFRVRPGLPAYGPRATSIPAGWGHGAREGMVVEFVTDTGETWIGNFEPGLGGADDVRRHPNGRDVLVIAAGTMWVVDPDRRVAAEASPAVFAVWPVRDPDSLVMSTHDLAFFRLGPKGVVWHTRRVSWDGFRDVHVSPTEITGLAWAPWEPEWSPFTVDLRTGRAQGGSYNGPGEDGWEMLAEDEDGGR